MLLTEYQLTSGAPCANPPGRICLRIRGQAEDQSVDLPRGKTTIGSSPRCNVRIQQPGVHPLHCLIVHEAGRLTVRRWAADTLLNGEPFDDAPLAVGDHLTLGSVDLELEAVGEAAGQTEADIFAESETPRTPCSWGKDTVHHTTVWVGEEEENLSASTAHGVAGTGERNGSAVALPADVVPAEAAREVFRQLQTANEMSRSRSRKLLDSLRTSRDAYRALSAQVAELEQQIETAVAKRGDSGGAPTGDDSTGEPSPVSAEWHAAEVARLTAQIDSLSKEKAELAAEHDARGREPNMLGEQLATAQQRYAEWDHLANQWEVQRAEWDAQRAEWDRQVGEWESRRAEQVRRIEELEAQLADACTTKANPESDPLQQTMRSQADAADSQQPDESAPQLGELSISEQGAAQEPSVGTDAVEAGEARVAASERQTPAEPPVRERHTPAWESEAPALEDRGPAQEGEAPSCEDRGHTGEGEAPARLSSPKSVESISPETSSAATDRLPAERCGSATPAPVAMPIQPNEREKSESRSAAEETGPVSYIQRYPQIFAEEASGRRPAPVTIHPPAADADVGTLSNRSLVRRDGDGHSRPPIRADHEESIEEYMAKLMRRVRGDQSLVATSETAPDAAAQEPDAASGIQRPNAAAADAASGPAAAGPLPVSDVGPRDDAHQQISDLSELVRKAPAIEQPTNLAALRALANETARRAIGIHATKKHRRDAVTKFLVASLAGIASVWLMMLAPDWRDLQFISACVSLLIASYWAGQTYGVLVALARVADYDRPDVDNVEHADDPSPSLSIDVERAVEDESTVESEASRARDVSLPAVDS